MANWKRATKVNGLLLSIIGHQEVILGFLHLSLPHLNKSTKMEPPKNLQRPACYHPLEVYHQFENVPEVQHMDQH